MSRLIIAKIDKAIKAAKACTYLAAKVRVTANDLEERAYPRILLHQRYSMKWLCAPRP